MKLYYFNTDLQTHMAIHTFLEPSTARLDGRSYKDNVTILMKITTHTQMLLLKTCITLDHLGRILATGTNQLYLIV
jgi:hypothetical protein